MPRTARASVGGVCYHVINRGNGRTRVFHKDRDFQAFVDLFEPACERLPMRILAWCLIPNHFHLVLWPRHDGDLSRWMQWLMTAHVRRYHKARRTSGHVWQGRFKAFPIQQDAHLLSVLRYVERNPLRAKLVRSAENWPWSSLSSWIGRKRPTWLAEGPVDRPRRWLSYVNRAETAAETAAELASLRKSVQRGSPFGTPTWSQRTADRLGLEASLNPRGRPRSGK